MRPQLPKPMAGIREIIMRKTSANNFISRSEKGFTLLEILVAISLIAVVFVVVMQLFSANLRAIGVSGSYVDAAAHAEAVMRNLLSDDDFPKSVSSGVTEDGYRYDATAAKAYEERTQALNADLYLVKVTIHWSDGAKERALTLQTLKLAEKKL